MGNNFFCLRFQGLPLSGGVEDFVKIWVVLGW